MDQQYLDYIRKQQARRAAALAAAPPAPAPAPAAPAPAASPSAQASSSSFSASPVHDLTEDERFAQTLQAQLDAEASMADAVNDVIELPEGSFRNPIPVFESPYRPPPPPSSVYASTSLSSASSSSSIVPQASMMDDSAMAARYQEEEDARIARELASEFGSTDTRHVRGSGSRGGVVSESSPFIDLGNLDDLDTGSASLPNRANQNFGYSVTYSGGSSQPVVLFGDSRGTRRSGAGRGGSRRGGAVSSSSAALTDEEIALRMQREEAENSFRIPVSRLRQTRRMPPEILALLQEMDDPMMGMNAFPMGMNDPVEQMLFRIHGRLPQMDVDNMSYEQLLALQERLGDVKPKGADIQEVTRLPTVRYEKPSGEVKESPDDSKCCVCMDQFMQGDELRRLPCFHSFHSECIDKWLVQNKICPVCRIPIDAEVPSDNNSKR
eukprot:TRINITY_DN1229_c0_g1_i2.p1 TRINITY_DN1229_c0_g1~~TRINITY_DN1229_c0_g1_i2.p1  ORF type:complete len:438 (-),score=91.52 TRINITY_DN1229_c0_g1_i2:24-1337(-)